MDWLGPAELAIIALSLKVSAVAIAGVLPLAFGLAWVLARMSFPGKVLLDAAVHLPLVLPSDATDPQGNCSSGGSAYHWCSSGRARRWPRQ